MAFFFADSWDLYSQPADAVAGGTWWDGTTANPTSSSFAPGRFPGNQGVSMSVSTVWVKSSGANDTVHHVAIAITASQITGTTQDCYIEFYDGTTAQCAVVFEVTGAITLRSGAHTGTTLATYTGAITAASTWYQFEIEVIVSNTNGGMRVRKNGNISNDYDSFTAVGNLDTSNTANNYANKVQIGTTNAITTIDDFIWRSDPVSVPWWGDIRAYARRPTGDVSVQWTPSGSGAIPLTPYGSTQAYSLNANQSLYSAFIAPCTGTIGSMTFPFRLAYTGSMKATIFASSGTAPTTILGSATPITNPNTVGNVTLTFPTPVPVVAGTQYWLGVCFDTSLGSGAWGPPLGSYGYSTYGLGGQTAANSPTYAGFPVANPTITTVTSTYAITMNVTPSGSANCGYVNEQVEDAANTYVYSTVAGQSELYSISALGTTPSLIAAVTVRAFMQKTDAGTRVAAVQEKSGSITVTSPTTPLNTVWGWVSRTDMVDPATGAAWTPAAVNNLQIGVQLVA